MTDRIIDISSDPARLHVRHDQLVIEAEGKPEATAPLAEIAALVVSNPRVSYSHTVLSGLSAHCAALVVCDEKHLPIGMMLPLAGHFVQAERFEAQANASLPVKKNIWKQIVTAKVSAQGRLLADLRGSDSGLMDLARRVKSGDSENIEAQASRRYWGRIFDDEKFRRDRDKDDQNRMLNYGYAVLRAIVARAICGAGLHPSIGVHHHNRYDTFCLADDLMEPFRPLVDRAVVKLVTERGKVCPMDKEAKAALINPLLERFELEGEQRTLFDISARAASSLAQVFLGKTTKLLLPEEIINKDVQDAQDSEEKERK
ncbi:MAG TPA: type II CRISPR-associated endonuclease Cas1 [bacterium]|nr:type II CRISPR-associated endonuclease Cas1 [bacterium]